MASGRAALVVGGAGVVAALGAGLWWRLNPSPCPYAQRFWVELPHPSITRDRLLEVLDPRPGERIVEVGPGTGYYTLSVARRLGPEGRLDIVDVQGPMLDHTTRRAGEAGLENVVPTRADARSLPYPDDTFDAAFVCVALGEVPDPGVALAELRRVLRPGGRLVVGESYLDPHVVRIGDLRRMSEAAGLREAGITRGAVGYFARLARP